MNVVEELVRQWETYRAGVVAELELIPEDKWQFRPAEGSRTVRALARHINQASLGFATQLIAEDASFARLFDPAFRDSIEAKLPKAETKAEIMEMLESTIATIASDLRGAASMIESKPMKSMRGEQSRITGLAFALGHEMYHRAQVAAIVRMLGITPALTQQVQGK